MANPTGRRDEPRWTSTTTGTRIGPLTTPGIALLLLVLVALLGALVVSRFHNGSIPARPGSTSSQIQTDDRETPEHRLRDGMIIPIVATHKLRATEVPETKDT